MGILEVKASITINVAQPEKEFNPKPSAKESTYAKSIALYAEDVGELSKDVWMILNPGFKFRRPHFYFSDIKMCRSN